MIGHVLVIMVFLINFAFPSVLSDRVALLTTAHKWTVMPVNTTLGSLDLSYSLLYWTDSGIWDPVKKKVRWVGGPGTCCANPADYKMINYDEATDTWTVSSTPFSGAGHSYDANAFNPGAGLHYFGLLSSPTIHAWNDATWTDLPNAPFSSTTPSLTWFPDINGGRGGLVFLGDNGNLAWYDGSKWTSLPAVGLSSYNAFSQYNPVKKAVWLGGGGGTAHFLLDSNLTVHKFADAPISMANGTTIHTCDPVSGKFLVCVSATTTWWEFDPDKDQWAQITDMTPKFSLASAFHIPIPEYGVIMVFNLASTTKNVYLYRHTLPAAVEQDKTPVSRGAAWEVTPNPMTASARIAIRNMNGNDTRFGIYSTDGRMVRDLTGEKNRLASGITLNPSGLPAGVYVLKAVSGKAVVTRRIAVMK